MGRKAAIHACNVGNWSELDGLVEAAYAAFGKVDILVNNAGSSPLAPSSLDTPESLFDRIVSLNFKGPFRLMSLVGSRMAAGDGGSIINISSAGALRPRPQIAPYAGAKAALNAITEAFAFEYGPKVRVNTISPGRFLTDVSKAWPEEHKKNATAALKRSGQPEEIVTAALYLASSKSSFTTGSIVRVDGGILMKMKAGILTVCGAPRPFAKSKPIHVVEVDLDPPGEGEVLVKVGGGGLCHSDLSLINGDRPRPVPIVLGHEGAGEIVEVGAGVHDVKKGDHVCFTFNVSCGRCRRCLEGRPYICERSVTPRAAGQLLSGHHRLHMDGKPVNHQSGVSCFAEYAVVDRGSVVVIDKTLPLDLAALFGCAVVTGVGAVINTAKIEPGSTVAVVGLGGVGLSGLLGAVLAGAGRIVAIDLADDKLGLARQLGATDTVNARDADHVKQVRDLTNGGVDYAFDLAGTIKSMETAYLVTRWGGTTVSAGLSPLGANFSFQQSGLVSEEKTIKGSYMGSCVPVRDIPRFIALYQQGKLPVDRMVSASASASTS